MINKAAKLMDYFKKSDHWSDLQKDLEEEAKKLQRETEVQKANEALRKYQQQLTHQQHLSHASPLTPQQAQHLAQQAQSIFGNQAQSYQGWTTNNLSGYALGYFHHAAEQRLSTIVERRLGKSLIGVRIEEALPILAQLVEKLDAHVPGYIHLGDQKKKGQSTVSCECGSDAIKHAIHADWCPAIQKKGEKE